MNVENIPPKTAAGKVIIIGGGIAGLSCGCYLQMNGIQSEILEMGALPGGLCTSWDRGPYVFDGCLRWLVGTNPSSDLYQIWMELGVIADREITFHDETVRMECADGTSLSVPADLDQLASEFKRIAPEDSALIDELVCAARRCASLEPPLKPLELMTLFEKIRLGLSYVPILPVFLKWKGLSVAKYLAKYRNTFLSETLLALIGYGHMSAFVLVMVLAFRSRRNTGFVIGGSRALTETIADRYTRLGGVIRCNTRVVSIRVENDCATGVSCSNGTLISASAVVSCADGHTTIFKMLNGRYVNKRLVRMYERDEPFPGMILVSLGINRAFPGVPQALSLPGAQSLMAYSPIMQHARMDVSVLGSDAGLCPEGKTLVTVRIPAFYDFWSKLKKDNPQGYQAEKKVILQKVVGILDRRFPGLAEHLEQSDVATPATFARYTANWRGSYEGWLPTPRMIGRRIPCTLPGLEDFYMAGHWVVAGGGLPFVALSGRYAAQMVCARNGKMFVATKP